MQLEIITPGKKIFEGEIKIAHFPGSQGEFEIMDKHAPMVSTLTKGILWIKPMSGEKASFQIKSGVLEVKQNKATVLVEI